MAVGIYKKGQGYWTRLMSAIAWGTLTLMGASWVWNVSRGVPIGDLEPVYIGATAAAVFFLAFGLLLFYLLGVKPKVVDFLIATEGEMKKVNWSTRREIIGSTWIVIGLTVFIAALLFFYDLIFQWFFRVIDVLES
jgi:preprotein translocase subunit SecE